MAKILYFGALVDQIGRDSEDIILPASIATSVSF